MRKARQGLVRHIITRVNAQGMLTLAINGQSRPALPAGRRTEAVTARLPLPSNTWQTAGDNVILGERKATGSMGKKSSIDEACGLQFELSPCPRFQVNSQISQQIYQDALALADLKSGDTAVDLYSGAGAITPLAARHCQSAIDRDLPRRWKNARANARLNGITATFHEGEAEKLLPALQKQGLRCDVLFLDPPRKGVRTRRC